MKTPKNYLATLDRIFEAEICNRLPAQFSKQAGPRLISMQDDGLIERMSITLPGRFPVLVEGWCLTHKGRIACGERKL